MKTKKLESIVCGAMDCNGMCRFMLMKCEDVKPGDCPNVRAYKEIEQ